jgi:hypothetical protein
MQQLTELPLVTNLDEDFDELRWEDELSHIVINYKRSACFNMSHKMTEPEWKTAQDIMLFCQWLQTGEKVEKIVRKKSTKKGKKRVNITFV